VVAVSLKKKSHRSSPPGHQRNVSNALGRALNWHPKQEPNNDDNEASALLNKMHHRKPWTL
jgi:hypothetical protein